MEFNILGFHISLKKQTIHTQENRTKENEFKAKRIT